MATFRDFENLRKLWEYMMLHEEVRPCDCILGLGSHDENVAARCADLYLGGFSDRIIFSGGLGRITKGYFDESEAKKFADIAISMGVPEQNIFIEDKSQNTSENFMFTDDLIHHLLFEVRTLLVVTKPAAERRIRATFDRQMPYYHGIITSPTMTFEEYMTYYYVTGMPIEKLINIVVGDVQRLVVYNYKGFQNFVDVPCEIIKTFNELVEAGYNTNLV